MDLDTLERLARAATPGPWRVNPFGVSIRTGEYRAPDSVRVADIADAEDCGCCPTEQGYATATYIAAASPDVLLALIARVRAAEAERDRLRALFDAAGAGEHDVLALVDHYQEEARKALIDREEAYPRVLQAAADVVLQHPRPFTFFEDVRNDLANDILDLSADEIDAFAEAQAKAHRAESGER